MMKKTTAEKTGIWLCPSHSGSDSESHTAPTTESSRHEITPSTRFTMPLHQSFPFAGRKSVGWRSAISSATIDTWPCRAAHVSSVSCFSVAPRAFTRTPGAGYGGMSLWSASASPAATSENSCTWVAVMARLRVMRPGAVASVGVSVIIARS